MANEVFHATVLNLHQPPGNLEYLLEHQEWAAKEVLYAMDRIPRSVWGYEDVARVHLVMSGTLLETLSSPDFQSRVYGIVKCGDLLWNLRHPSIDFLGTGYYHPVMPLTPADDRLEQACRWLKVGRHLFDRQKFYGFWPPEMGFCMEMIPMLKEAGYRYVLVDSEHVEPVESMRWEEIRYRPHIAKYDGHEIIVVVRDRDLSNAQESGMDIGWFMYEVEERTRWCDFPALITTCSDGDNGGWFRNTNMAANYWGAFYQPLMDKVRKNEAGFSPAFIHEYLNMYGAEGEVKVNTGAWNTGWHDGRGFVQWTGSQEQKDALARVNEVSFAYHRLREKAEKKGDKAALKKLEEVYWLILRAETSCNFYWGADWVGKAHKDLDEVEKHIQNAKK